MLFNSYSFMIFFPIVLAIYFVIPKKARYMWLLLASYYFYMGWNVKYAALIAFSTIITYVCGRLLGKTQHKKWVIGGCIGINLAILFFFKYFDFFMGSVNQVLAKVGVSPLQTGFDIILPVGISFYTFQALGYIIDVYRGDIEPEKNFFRYALFVSFFPQLVAGPIERSKNLLKQVDHVEEIRLWNYKRIADGLTLMLWGYFLKMVIADRVAILVDTVYNQYWMYGSIEIILATFLFGVQIYCDFASYSQIAIGAAKVMGFELMENFNAPYLANSVKDFWRRWHISLSSWFKDYLYIPLGGNRCSRIKKYRNLMITFLVSGLWHGANWTFVIWGGLHGIYQIIGDVLRPVKEKLNQKLAVKTESFSYKFGQIAITYILVSFTWLFFRAESVTAAFDMIRSMFVKFNPWVLFDQSLYTLGLNVTEVHILLVAVVILILVDGVRFFKAQTIERFLNEQCLYFRWGIIFFLIFYIFIFGSYGIGYSAQQFIYFQF